MMSPVLYILACGFVSVETQLRKATGEFRLYNDIIWNNNPYERPVYNKSETITVEFDFNLHTVSQYIESQQQLLCTGWFFVTWSDQFLTWNSEMYDGVEFIRPPDSYVWKPDIVVSNSFQQLDRLGGDFVSLKLFSNGHIQWMPGDLFYLPCNVDVELYPFDSLRCFMNLVVWSHSVTEVDLKPRQSRAGVSSSNIRGQWSLTSAPIMSLKKHSDNKTMSTVKITLTLERLPTNFVFNFILPVMILSLLGTFVFLIPADSGEKVSFAITIPLSYGVYMGFLTNMVPQSSEGVSTFIIFLGITLSLSALFVILSIFSVRISARSNSRPVPKAFQRITVWVEHVKNCGRQRRLHPNHISEDTEQSDECEAKEHIQVMTWNRVSSALDLFFFWVLCIPLLIVIPVLLLSIAVL
ncbi:neuronal acetylcholine receptor subunit alpha-7-like [Haliotis rufescens]|uniref:neuronal acetylcholine receptor subunit alpha-7-like n=1 Tax=Haliotis rufescens TaxID=6454 RepID=UPI001EB09127|nr:neuronal acetylcholine receptor subunit alpha-7-like [Haliotis rufescens]